MAEPKWEELNKDCLVNVLRRVGIESLLLDVPFVCKSWYRASLNPSCWECLIFPKIGPVFLFENSFMDRLMKEYQIEGSFSVTSFIKFIINRSHGNPTMVILPRCCTEEALKYVADKCPALKTLGLPFDLCCRHSLIIPELIRKWKNLEFLKLGFGLPSNLEKILAEISLHCMNFCGLAASGPNVRRNDASAIVNLLPKIKYLHLRGAAIDRENLLMILEGCKELVLLDVRGCVGFDEGDDQILKLASHICKFQCEGSITVKLFLELEEFEDDDYDEVDDVYEDEEFNDDDYDEVDDVYEDEEFDDDDYDEVDDVYEDEEGMFYGIMMTMMRWIMSMFMVTSLFLMAAILIKVTLSHS